MVNDNFKKIVILKDLPSNIVDEAIVILKPNNKIKKIEVVDKKSNKKSTSTQTGYNQHVINEAEMLVNNYICELEKKEKKENTNDITKEKIQRLKKYLLVSNIILIMSLILHFV